MNRAFAISLALVVCLSVVARYAQADVVLGDFETTALDAWGTDGGDASFDHNVPFYAQSTTGVTLNSHSLAVTQNVNPAGLNDHFDGPATGNLVTQVGLNNLTNAVQLSYDETFLSTELFQTKDPNDPNSPPTFAESRNLIWSIFGSGGSLGTSTINLRGQHNPPQGQMTDSANTGNNRGTWGGVDHTSHVTWDLTTFTMTDPTDNTIKTFTQLMANHPDVNWNTIFQIPIQSGCSTNNDNDAFSTFFFDNVAITVPEPASIGLLALSSFAIIRRRRST
ncbi:MAG TPA: PEP-CTERM sorting domain-containing protein [Tepidisphaeraceae bacterium]|nr:PEP-CTERM sorting domain-containing protein [Tepidisphaeraceae bacterium]